MVLNKVMLYCMCRTINQGWYSYYSCASGWFCPNAPPVRNNVVLKARSPLGSFDLPLCSAWRGYVSAGRSSSGIVAVVPAGSVPSATYSV